MKKIDVKKFREQGYLQELNRQFLHPLGLALAVHVDDDGNETLDGIWDVREDEEGMIYDPSEISKEKALNVLGEQAEKCTARLAALGYLIQPIDRE